jgi:hypothetical protein
MLSKKSVLISLVVILVLVASFFTLSLTGFSVYTEARLNVSILAVAEISVIPVALVWTDISPGHTGGIKYLDVRNIGSKTVSNVHTYINTLTVEDSRPYETADVTNYAAGGVIVLISESDYGSDYYYYAGRIEWNWTEPVSNTDYSNIPNPVAWGFYRNVTNEYFWAVTNGTGGSCNNSGAKFGITDAIDDGTSSTRKPEITEIIRDGGDAGYSYFSINRIGSPLYHYCVAVNATCNKIYIYRYDKRSGFSTCSNSKYLTPGNLYPGEVERVRTDVYLPYGIPDGQLSEATITFSATTS